MSETAKQTRQRGRRNILTGQVISSKMDKTVSVLIYNSIKHPKYKKYIKRTSVFKAHDEKNQAKEGDVVKIFETRALSKTKRWSLLELVKSGKAAPDKRDYGKRQKKKAQEEPANHRAEEAEGDSSSGGPAQKAEEGEPAK